MKSGLAGPLFEMLLFSVSVLFILFSCTTPLIKLPISLISQRVEKTPEVNPVLLASRDSGAVPLHLLLLSTHPPPIKNFPSGSPSHEPEQLWKYAMLLTKKD